MAHTSDEPHESDDTRSKIGFWQAVSSIIATMVGAAIFLLPQAVAKVGLIGGLFVGLLFGYVLLTATAIAVPRCIELCEELDVLEPDVPVADAATSEQGPATGFTRKFKTITQDSAAEGKHVDHLALDLEPTVSEVLRMIPSTDNLLHEGDDTTVLSSATAKTQRAAFEEKEHELFEEQNTSVAFVIHVAEGDDQSDEVIDVCANTTAGVFTQPPVMLSTAYEEEPLLEIFTASAAGTTTGGNINNTSMPAASMQSGQQELHAVRNEGLSISKADGHDDPPEAGLRTAENGVSPPPVVLRRKRKIYLLPDVAEKAFGSKVWRKILSVSLTVTLVLTCAVFIVVFGSSIQTLVRQIRIIAGDRDVRLEEPPRSVWKESLVSVAVMSTVVQLRDISSLAKFSFVGTLAIFFVLLVFVFSPVFLHAGHITTHGFPDPIMGGWVPRSATGPEPLPAGVLLAQHDRTAGPHETESHVWAWSKERGAVQYTIAPLTAVGEICTTTIDALTMLAFAFAFAFNAPHIRAGMEKPEQMPSAILVSKTVVLVTFALVILLGNLGIGADKLLASDSVFSALEKYGTKVVRTSDYTTKFGQNPEWSASGETILASANGYALLVNPLYYFGNVPRGALMGMTLAILMMMKLLLSYPLAIWPVLMDIERRLGKLFSERGRRGDAQHRVALEGTHEGNRNKAACEDTPLPVDEQRPLLPCGGPEMTEASVAAGDLEKGTLPRMTPETFAADIDQEQGHDCVRTPLYASVLARVLLVCVTYGIGASLRCEMKRLGAVVGLAISTGGMVILVFVPLAAHYHLHERVRVLKKRPKIWHDHAQAWFYLGCALLGILMFLQAVATAPREIADALAASAW
ncbi:unnamed protein product [Amoebophrya sp. A120]|nr:unnamed protein product [Amoebophrya sp. A120]|eukprot:GSA120T00002819001.1